MQKHPILKCVAITIENKQIIVMALFRNEHSTIMVCYGKESEYAFRRENDRSDWEPIKYILREILNELGGGTIINDVPRI